MQLDRATIEALQTKKLPDVLSDLIELAINDLEWVESRPGYRVIMDTVWHSYADSYDHCAVCFAGAVMAHTLELPREYSINPTLGPFTGPTVRLLSALDAARRGDWVHALYEVDCARADAGTPRLFCPDEVAESAAANHLLTVGEMYRPRVESMLKDLPFVPSYEGHPEEFKGYLRRAVDVLREHNL